MKSSRLHVQFARAQHPECANGTHQSVAQFAFDHADGVKGTLTKCCSALLAVIAKPKGTYRHRCCSLGHCET